MRSVASKKTWVAMAIVASVGMPKAALAQSTYIWDSSGTHPNAPIDGSGNWDTSTADWSNGVSNIVWPNDNSIAAFGNGGTAGMVTLQTGINAGALLFNPVSSGSYTIASGVSALTLNASGAVGLNNASANISASIGGSVGLEVNGTGTLNLSGTNTYTGNTLINAGTLQLGSGAAVPATTALTVNSGATFDVDGQAPTIASLAGAGSVLVESGSNLTINQSTNTTFSGSITGSGTVTKLLAGNLTLTAPETSFTGTLAMTNTVNNTITLTGNANINNSTIVVNNGSPTGGGPAFNLSNLATAFSAPVSFTSGSSGTGDYRLSFNGVAGSGNTITSPISVTYPNVTLTSHPSLVFTSNTGNLSVSSNITVNSDAAQGIITFRGALSESFTGKITAPSTVQVATTDGGVCYFNPHAGSTWGGTSLGGPSAAGPGYGLDITSDSALNGSTAVAGGSNSLLFAGGHLQLDGYTSNLNFVQANMGNTTTDALDIGSAAVNAQGASVSSATYGGSISLSGTNPVNFIGPGTLIFSGSVSYSGSSSGAIGVTGGVLQMGNSNPFPSTSALSISAGATLDANNNLIIVKSLAGAGSLLLTGSNSDIQLYNSTGTFSGAISGAGEFDEVAGTLTLSGNNSFSGGLYIGGTLTVGNAAAIPSASDVTDFGTLALGAINTTLGSLAGSGAVTGSGNLTVGANNNSEVFGGQIKTSGSVTLTGTSTWQLANNNTYTGATNVNSGTLQLGTGNALPTGTTLNIAAAGTVDLNGNNQQIGALTGSGAILLNGQLAVGGARVDSLFSGTINGNGSLAVAEGAQTLALTGVNNYTGGTQLNNGTLAINSDSAVDITQVAFNGGALQFMNYASNAMFNNVFNLTLGASSGAASTLNGPITGGNSLIYNGPGTLVITSNNNNYSGGTIINAGNLQFAAGAFPGGQITLNNSGALNVTGAFTSVTQALSFIDSADGNGVVALMGDSSENIDFSQHLGVSLGAGANSTYTGTITPSVNYDLGGGGATLTLPNNNAIAGNFGLIIGPYGSPGTVALTGVNSNFTGPITLAGGVLAINSDAAINNGGGAVGIGFNGGTLQFDNYASNLTTVNAAAGVVSVGAAAGAPSTMNLIIPSGASFNYQGPGTLLLGSSASLSATGALVVNAGTLDLNGNSPTVASLAGAGNINTESGSTLTIGAAGSTTYSGVISGGGGLTKNNTGTLNVTAANTLTGPVNITQTGNTAGTILALSGAGSFNNASSLTLTNLVSTGGTNNVTLTLSNLLSPMSVPIDIVTPTTGGDFRIAMNNVAGNNTVTSPVIMNAGDNGTNVSTLTYSSAAGTLMTISSAVTIPATNGAHSITSPVWRNQWSEHYGRRPARLPRCRGNGFQCRRHLQRFNRRPRRPHAPGGKNRSRRMALGASGRQHLRRCHHGRRHASNGRRQCSVQFHL